jgi:hypothetical protein
MNEGYIPAGNRQDCRQPRPKLLRPIYGGGSLRRIEQQLPIANRLQTLLRILFQASLEQWTHLRRNTLQIWLFLQHACHDVGNSVAAEKRLARQKFP